MRIITTTKTVYKFDELSDSAKEKARDWYRGGSLDYEWWDGVYEDAERVGLKIKEFDIDRGAYVKAEFKTSAEETAHKIEQEHGESCDTFIDSSNYLKERESIVRTPDDIGDKLDELDGEFLKTLCEDYRIMLQKEYEYLLSNESVDESIQANEYEFLENGKVA